MVLNKMLFNFVRPNILSSSMFLANNLNKFITSNIRKSSVQIAKFISSTTVSGFTKGNNNIDSNGNSISLYINEHCIESLKCINRDVLKDLKEKNVFAVVHIGGSQFKIAHNDVIMINKRIEAECGDLIKLEKILAVGGRNFTFLGQPLLKRELVNIEAMVMEKTKGEKKIVFKKKRRKGYKRWKGHRQDISVLKIKTIDFDTALL